MHGCFAPKTFETFKIHSPTCPYGEAASYGVPFPIFDPFGLRRAVVPVFQCNPDGSAVGVGTAFHVDGWGRLLTADHVVDHVRTHHASQIAPDILINVDITRSTHAAVLLGYGLVYGKFRIPKSCWAPLDRLDAFLIDRDVDPMAALRGRSSTYEIGPDIAGVNAVLQPDSAPFHTVPVNLRTYPAIGEIVFAVGYPELSFETVNADEIARYLNEGMFGVYGRVTNLCPAGRGKTRPSPGFEVEADWPAGMSGGPVFNQNGEVIGIVSSSLPSSDAGRGVGFATSLAMVPNLSTLVPTLDFNNPGCRLGFGVYRGAPWHLADVFRSQEEAEHLKAQLPSEYIVRWGSHRIGTDDFIHSMVESGPGVSANKIT